MKEKEQICPFDGTVMKHTWSSEVQCKRYDDTEGPRFIEYDCETCGERLWRDLKQNLVGYFDKDGQENDDAVKAIWKKQYEERKRRAIA
jgi:hypothetical protein